jgi:hypothetical protein
VFRKLEDTPYVVGGDMHFVNWEDAPFINGSDLQFREGTHGASHHVSSPRACVSNSRDVMMPTYGSRDVRFDDVDTHHVAAFINGDAYGEVRDAFYES